MNPSRELDALIAEKVMGWVIGTQQIEAQGQFGGGRVDIWVDKQSGYKMAKWDWSPSTSIEAAWDVVEKLKGKSITIESLLQPDKDNWMGFMVTVAGKGSICALTAPHAICLAALAAVGVTL